MRKNKVKEALKAGLPQVGTWLTLGSEFAARLMARVGFPWLTVDLEHYPIGWDTAGRIFATVSDFGVVCLARIPRGDHTWIKRTLDAGAHGIIVPMVNTVEEAKIAIAAAIYPPVGNRSVGGGTQFLSFDATAGDYFKNANDEILVILQTESPEGVRNAEEIYSLPGIDAIFVGPNDLMAQMRTPDGKDPSPEEFEATLQKILATAKKCKVPVGLHLQSVEDVHKRIAEGWQFIAIGSELKFLVTEAQNIVKGVSQKAAEDLARY
jgi:4-hydroxy-2-oxoheptanedioate aldolase